MRMRYHRTTSAGACGRYVSKEPTAATNNGLRPWRPARRTMCGASRNGSAIPPSRVSYRQTPPNFDEFWIYDLNRQLDEPMDRVGIAELVERYTALNFLFPQKKAPLFNNDRVAVTRAA